MDFVPTEEQQAIAELSARILTDHATVERLKEVEAGDDRFDARAWDELARANLLGLVLPEDVGGSGYGWLEACLMLEAAGRTAAPIPLLWTLAAAAAIAEHGTEAQRQRWLPGVATGDTVLTCALAGDTMVPAAHLAAAVLVLADGAMSIVPRESLALTRQLTTSGEPQFGIAVTGHDGEPLGGPEVQQWLTDRCTVGLCALQAGITDRALRLTAEYTTGRQQFERPIASFQAVSQRLADAYVDAHALRLTMLQAAWRLAEGLPAAEEVAIAKYWASDGAQRVLAACQHLHGGIGVDLDYPLHRYTLMGKQIELTLGSGTRQLASLGELLR